MHSLNEEKVKKETRYSQMHYDHLKQNLESYEKDERREYRLKELLCKTCFYLKSGFAGQAFTKYVCKNCGKENHHRNTDVPNYCHECAQEHQCCIRCAAEV